ncbi:MAG: OmpH family outer membrane protein [Chitinophagales bacterium]
MKYASYIVNGILAIAVAVLYYLHFSGKNCQGCAAKPSTATSAGSATPGNIAFIDVDSLEANYGFFKDKKAELEKRQKAIESTLESKAQTLQREAYELQQRAQAGQLTQAEGEAAQQRLMQKQQELEQSRDNMSASFMADQQEFNKNLNARLDTFLQQYNKDKKYTYVLSYIRGGSILYKDQSNDITREVLEGMNKQYNNK